MNRNYEIVDISGDVALKIFGETLADLFVAAGNGLYALATASPVCDHFAVKVAITASSRENMLVKWLNELIFELDARGFIGSTIEVATIVDTRIHAVVHGELFDRSIHAPRLLVKAATYHGLTIQETAAGFEATVIFDV